MKMTLLKTSALAAIGTTLSLALQALPAQSLTLVNFTNFDLTDSPGTPITPFCLGITPCSLPLTVNITRGSTEQYNYNDTGGTIGQVIYQILTPDAQFGTIDSSTGFNYTLSPDLRTLTFTGYVEPEQYVYITRTVRDQATGEERTVNFNATVLPVPEHTSPLSLLALGILGVGLTLKRQFT